MLVMNDLVESRTIPTRVGKTPYNLADSMALADHPHACGENVVSQCSALFRDGPSPRVWGKPQSNATSQEQIRTIPTRVGKTEITIRAYANVTDHPHACGENAHRRGFADPASGPSPRVWGKQCF